MLSRINSIASAQLFLRAGCRKDIFLILIIGAALALFEATVFLFIPKLFAIKNDKGSLDILIYLGVVVLLVRGGLFAFGQYLLSMLSYSVKAKIASTSMKTIERNHPFSDDRAVIQMFTTEIGHLVGYFIAPITVAYAEIFVLTMIIFALSYNYGFVVLSTSLTLMLVGLIYYFLIRSKLTKLSQVRVEMERNRTKLIVEWAHLLDTLKISKRDAIISNRINKLTCEVSRLEGKQYFGIQLPRLWLEVIGIPSVIIVIYLTQTNFDTENIGVLLTSAGLAAFRILPSVNRLLSALQTLKYAQPIIESFNSFYTANFPVDECDIEEVKLKPGTKMFLLGKSGSGKTTRVKKLLLNNKILVQKDGHFTAPNLVSYLSQGHEIFSSTIDDNINFFESSHLGKTDIDDILSKYSLNKLIGNRPRERSITPESVSGGEKVRLCLARTFERDNELIVLDEPTNGLDDGNVEFLKVLLEKTDVPLIVITHDERIMDLATEKIQIE